MALACRSAVGITKRSLCTRSSAVLQTLAPKLVPASSFASPTRSYLRPASRFVAALGSVETMLPLHSIVAAARLKSNIAIDTSCWSWLSQGCAMPR